MLYAEDNIERPKYHFKFLLKVFSIFKIRIIYDETIDNEYFPETVGIMFINCGKLL